jgi:hypothetical protein
VLAMFMRLGADGDAFLRTLCVISFAAVAGLALANANNAASAAMHAMSRGTHWTHWHFATLVPAVICAVGFCLSSVIGVHLGWEIMTQGVTHAQPPKAEQVLIAAAFLAFAKPAMSWVIEGRRTMDKAEADAAEALENARLDALRQADIASRSPNVTHLPSRVRRTLAGAAAFALAASAASGTQADAAPQVQEDAPSPTPASDALTHSEYASVETPLASDAAYDARVEEARRLLLSGGRSNRAIARLTHLSPSKVDRLAREMTPMRSAAA